MKTELNQVLVPTGPSAPFTSPQRVLCISRDEDVVWTIPLRPAGKGKNYKYYQPGVETHCASDLERALQEESLSVAAQRLPLHWLLADEDYIAAAHSDVEKNRRRERLKKRDELLNLLESIIEKRTVSAIAKTYRSLGPTLAEIAKKAGKDVQAIRRALHLYLQSGGIKNALLPLTENCGAKGQARNVTRPMGRPKKPLGTGNLAPENYVITNDDKRRCALGYTLVQAGNTLSAAYQIAKSAYWSQHIIDEEGNHKSTPLPQGQRPSKEQFAYWGRKGSEWAMEKVAGKKRTNRRSNTITRSGGASTDTTSMVGINAMFDGTSCDIYLVSITSRNRVLPPMTRMIIKEPISSAVIGVYCDWQSPSPNSALKAILAAAEDKHALCAKYGVDCPEGAWPGILCKSYLADNGELRAAEITEAERVFGFSIEYARTYDGASKGDVESQHRTDHVGVDHALPGTTRGKQRKRGEENARDTAILNHFEYMGILLRHYINYNNEMVPERAPLEMIQAGINPTRINVLKWYRETHQSVEITVDLEHLRAHTLTRWPAVIKENGVYLKSEDKGRVYNHHRYFSEGLLSDRRFKDVQASRKTLNVIVRVDIGIDRIWLPTETGLLLLKNVSTDATAVAKASIADIDDYSLQLLEAKRARKPTDEQNEFVEVMAREAALTNARSEKRDEDRARGGAPSKTQRNSNARKNAEKEMLALGANDAASITSKLENRADSLEQRQAADAAMTASEQAMVAFMSSIS